MHIIHLHSVAANYAARTVFRDISWVIDSRDRVGLVGPNGAGKSTLLKLVAGELAPEDGQIVIQRGVRVGYLKQDIELPPGQTLIEAAMTPPPTLAAVEAELGRIEDSLGDPAVYGDEARLTQTLEEQEHALAEYTSLGGDRHRSRVRGLLHQLGFTPADDHLPVESLSGGQKKLIALLLLAVESPDVLLLDEPDNHLDMHAKRHLEAFIRGYEGGIIIVSHDRYLLDETIKQIVELEDGKLKVYHGNYTHYAEQKEIDKLKQMQTYITQQKQVNKINEQIAQFAEWARLYDSEKFARKARHRRRMLERLEESGELVDQVRERRLMDLQINGSRGSTKALEVKKLSMAFDDTPIFFDVDLLVQHGERVGLIGPNGAGKSVLFRLILGEMAPLDGDIVVGPSTKIGYYAQEHQTLNAYLHRTPIELIRDIRPMPEGEAVSKLLKFAFTYEQTRQAVGTLSGGERSRVQLLRLMLQNPNLLLLDEPTNNLDIASVEVLETAINEFEGAVLAISHDRYFLDRMADRVVELDDGELTGYIGGYSDYLAVKGY